MPAIDTLVNSTVGHHVWKKGDTFSKIAKRFYGDPDKWINIAHYNKIKHPKRMKPGRRIRLP